MDLSHGHGDGQYLAPLDETIAEQIVSDPVAVSVIRGLNGRDLDISELESVIPGGMGVLDRLISVGIVTVDGVSVRLSEPYRAYGAELDRDDGLWDALTSPKVGWRHYMGFASSDMAGSLLSLLFDVEPTWDGAMADAAAELGLTDGDGSLTERGRDVASRLFSVVAGFLEPSCHDPGELLVRWLA